MRVIRKVFETDKFGSVAEAVKDLLEQIRKGRIV